MFSLCLKHLQLLGLVKKLQLTLYFLLCLSLLLIFTKALANPELGAPPRLVDISINGSVQDPIIVPTEIRLIVDEQTLLVIDNPFDKGYTFSYDEFGQAVHTHFIQNSPNVSTQGVSLTSKSKTMWMLTPRVPGKYRIYAVRTSQEGPHRQYSWIHIDKAEHHSEKAELQDLLPSTEKTETKK